MLDKLPRHSKLSHAFACVLLIQQLEQDRAWLLEQIDRGRWQEFRLDLAALERELGQLLQRASEHFSTDSDQR